MGKDVEWEVDDPDLARSKWYQVEDESWERVVIFEEEVKYE